MVAAFALGAAVAQTPPDPVTESIMVATNALVGDCPLAFEQAPAAFTCAETGSYHGVTQSVDMALGGFR